MARILVVDNDPDFVRTARGALQPDGYQVLVATDAGEALNLMAHAAPDLVLLDNQFRPEADGVDLTDAMSRNTRLRQIPKIIVDSAPEGGEEPDASLENTLWLSKPVKPETLLDAVAGQVTRTAFVYSPQSEGYEYGPDHPMEPRRASETVELCHKYSQLDRPWVDVVEPRPAGAEEMALFHDRAYLAALQEANDGVFDEGMLEFGLGTSLVDEGRYDLSFNLSGGFHHAHHRSAEGFCYVNDIAIAIRQLLRKGRRIAYVDLDAHHGDGVQDAFYNDNRVLTISLHESGKTLFPWSGFETEIGTGEGKGYNINIPLPPQTDDEIFLEAFNAVVPEAIIAFDPDFVFALVGADGLLADPLSHLALTNNAYAEAAKIIEAISPKCVALGGGGYQMNSVTRAWCLAWAVMNGIEPEDEYAGTIGGMMLGTEYVEGGGLRDRHAYTTGPLKVEIRKEVVKVTEYIKDTVFPLITPTT
jgi:acetoin utilization protein AcuC